MTLMACTQRLPWSIGCVIAAHHIHSSSLGTMELGAQPRAQLSKDIKQETVPADGGGSHPVTSPASLPISSALH